MPDFSKQTSNFESKKNDKDMKDNEIQDLSPKTEVNVEKEKAKAAVAGAMAGAAGIGAATWMANASNDEKEEEIAKDESHDHTAHPQNDMPLTSEAAYIPTHEAENQPLQAEAENTDIEIMDISMPEEENFISEVAGTDNIAMDEEFGIPTDDCCIIDSPETEHVDYFETETPENMPGPEDFSSYGTELI